MIQWIAEALTFSTSRRVPAVLLAVLMNLAIAPCTMALEVIEEGHDCCPPKLSLESSECCEVDEVNVDIRGGALKLNDTPDPVFAAGAPNASGLNQVSVLFAAAVDPPDPPTQFTALHKRFCIYLI